MSSISAQDRNAIRMRASVLDSEGRDCTVAPVTSFDFKSINLPFALLREQDGEMTLTMDSSLHGVLAKQWRKVFKPFLRSVRKNDPNGYFIIQYYETAEDKNDRIKTFALVRIFPKSEVEEDATRIPRAEELEKIKKVAAQKEAKDLRNAFLDIENISFPVNVTSSYFSVGDRYMIVKKGKRQNMEYSYSVDGRAYSTSAGDTEENIGIEYEEDEMEKVISKVEEQESINLSSIFDLF